MEKFCKILCSFLKEIKLFIFVLIKTLKVLARKIYVYNVLSVRNRWYLSKNKNYYNPSLQATVYKWGDGWNIARFSVHYNGYKTKNLAQQAAFKMWMKERLKRKNIFELKNEVQNVSLQNVPAYTKHEDEGFIKFVIKNGWYVTRLGDTALSFVYDSNNWELNWERYEITTQCEADWWCHSKNYDLSLLDLNKANPEDELCYECPRVKAESIIDSAHAADKWINSPSNLEEVRVNILEEYKKLPHNGLNNKYLYKIMHSKWARVS